MTAVLAVAAETLREARRRRWIQALVVGVALSELLLAAGLELRTVDGALASLRLFGRILPATIQPIDVAVRPVLRTSAYLLFYCGIGYGIISCSDFAPNLLRPGRVEYLLALPLRRWQLLFGTFLGVWTVAAIGAVYGAGGVVLLLGMKTGVWSLRLFPVALLAAFTFAAVYGTMLASAVFVPRASISALVGFLFCVLGIGAAHRDLLANEIHNWALRALFFLSTAPIPPVSTIATAAADFAASDPCDAGKLTAAVVALPLFGIGAVAIAMFRFEKLEF